MHLVAIVNLIDETISLKIISVRSLHNVKFTSKISVFWDRKEREPSRFCSPMILVRDWRKNEFEAIRNSQKFHHKTICFKRTICTEPVDERARCFHQLDPPVDCLELAEFHSRLARFRFVFHPCYFRLKQKQLAFTKRKQVVLVPTQLSGDALNRKSVRFVKRYHQKTF